MAESNRRSYSVYVIELEDPPGETRVRPDKPFVYVGQTSVDPEVRFQQHREGHKSSKWPRKYGKHLKPRLYRNFNPLPDRAAAEAMEARLAEKLRKRGYGVKVG